MTEEVLRRLRAAGFGAGRHTSYQPWIRIRRSFSSPVSNQQLLEVPFACRHLHLLSRLEGQYALLGSFLGALESREQVPTHVEPDLHPGFDSAGIFPIEGTNCRLPGLLDIAREVNVDPGVYPGTSIPFVPTTDLVLTVKDGRRHKLVYWPVKPHSELFGKQGVRRQERLCLEQRRAEHAGAFFHVMTDQTVSKPHFVDNLRAYKPHHSALAKYGGTPELTRFADAFNRSKDMCLLDAWLAAGATVGMHELDKVRLLFDVALYSGVLDINISVAMAPHLPISWGGMEKRSKLRKLLMGLSE